MLAQKLQQAHQLAEQGHLQQAQKLCEEILQQVPDHTATRYLLGLVLLQLGQAAQAAPLIESAVQQGVVNAEVLHHLAVAKKRSGEVAEAASLYRQLIADFPGQPQWLAALAEILIQQDEISQAEQFLKKALDIDPEFVQAHAILAQLCEQKNDDEAAEDYARKALAMDAANFTANYVKASVALKRKHYPEAEQLLTRLVKQPDSSPVNQSLVWNKLGHLLDKTDRYDFAFQAFTRSNALLAPLADSTAGFYSMQWIAQMDQFFSSDELSRWQLLTDSSGDLDSRLVFLVGFPRSGTTLMDRMLDAHTGITVLEEKPLLNPVLADYANELDDLLRLRNSDDDELQSARNNYVEQLPASLLQSDQMIVDKLPLNSLYLPVISRLFPQARIVFMVRDPRDVILSCFFQNFALNEGMRHFLELRTSADYYVAVMSLVQRYMSCLPLTVCQVRYEDLIRNPVESTSRLTQFLGLNWESSMLDYHQKAKKSRINTPSYAQVTQPLYRSSAGRWQNYQSHLQPVLPGLDEFVSSFGYQSMEQ